MNGHPLPDNPQAVLPTLFLSHGAPDILMRDTEASAFLSGLGERLSRPRGIVVVSAHWQREKAAMTGPGPLRTLHDFGGFDATLYQMRYPASGTDWLVRLVAGALDVEVEALVDADRGLDHGVWIPLKLAWPKADLPVAQLSLPLHGGLDGAWTFGRRLSALPKQGILLVGSGSVTHNLARLKPPGSPPDEWAEAFTRSVRRIMSKTDGAARLATLTAHPHFQTAHPTEEHLAPLMVVMAAAGESPDMEPLHDSWDYGNLNMGAYRFLPESRGTEH